MGDNDNSGLILGLIIGALIAIALFSRNAQTINSTQTQQYQQSKQYQQPQDPIWKPMDIPRVDDIKPVQQQPIVQMQQDPRLTQIMSELEKTNSQLEQTTSKLQELQNTTSKLQELENSVSKLQTQNVQSVSQHQAVIQPETISQLEQTTSRLLETVSKLEQNNRAHLQTTSKLQETVSKLEHENSNLMKTVATTEPRIIHVSQIPQISQPSQPTQLSQQSQQTQQHQPIQTQQIYKNSEKWLIKRGPNGRLKSLEIARDVEKKN